jgi:hypothetical protein
MDSIKPFS